MLFRPQKPPTRRERIATILWPRRSFGRSAKYFIKRALRLNATPHAIAVGIAAGAGVSFLPTPGLHFLLAAIAAWGLGGNVVASALGTMVGNPLTFPLMWGASFQLGKAMLSGDTIQDIEPMPIGGVLRNLEFGELWEPLVKPIFVGSIPLGLLFGLVLYGLIRWAVAAFQEERRRKRAERAGNVASSGKTPAEAVAGS
ncbi:MAG TPA: DUF2062 domain-containing protein [Mesorhizobium sp.]|jgi:hypothetical protein|nr:DUF2062 domain-containing protein [Mesorhizobium sp.]